MLALSISGATNKDSTEDSTRLALQFLATTAATTSLYLMVTLATKCVRSRGHPSTPHLCAQSRLHHALQEAEVFARVRVQ